MNRAGFIETFVGVLVVISAALFFVYGYAVSGRDLAHSGYELNAVFGKVDGVTSGSEVRIAGVKIGTVAGHELDTQTYEARLKMTIAANVPVPDDSIAKIVSDGVLGGAHVAIEPGASEDYLRDGEAITITQGSVDLLGLAVQAFTNNAASSDKPASDDAASEGDEDDDLLKLDPLGDL